MKNILDHKFHYTSSVATDVKKTFARVRREICKLERAKSVANTEASKKVLQIAAGSQRPAPEPFFQSLNCGRHLSCRPQEIGMRQQSHAWPPTFHFKMKAAIDIASCDRLEFVIFRCCEAARRIPFPPS